MPQSLSQIYFHIIFSTKHREPLLKDRSLQTRTHAYISGTCRNLESPSIIVNGVEDHVHILCRLARTLCVSDLVRDLKRDSSKWLKEQSPDLDNFYWQSGYGAFSVGPKQLDAATKYIADQEEHHKTATFQGEFRRFYRSMASSTTSDMCGIKVS